MPKLKVIFTQETIISRKKSSRLSTRLKAGSLLLVHPKDRRERKSGTMIAVIVSQVRKG
ncbi:MAG: hypothetical protein ACLS7Z_01170 [Christensenellales bacterium]